MKRVTLKRIQLLNFKGIRSLSADFSGGVTRVSGRNASGKTTLFDAFTWLLFGKDSRGRQDFDIKTLDQSGAPIPRLPHEVTATIEVDGQEVTLTRCFTEKWTKKRGSATEEMTRNETKRLYDSVPCNEQEWSEKISAICPEQTFRQITSPFHFTSMKKCDQRQRLIEMAGGFSDNEVIAASGQRQDFIELLGRLCGKTMDEYGREIAAKKRLIKNDIDAIPERIDERRRDNEAYASTDYDQAERELSDKQKALADVEKRLNDATARINEAFKARQALADRLTSAKERMMQLTADTRAKASEQYYQTERRRDEIRRGIDSLKAKAESAAIAARELAADIEQKTRQRAALMTELNEIRAMTLTLTMGDFTCPTCHQTLPPDNIEQKRAEMTESFNAAKAERMRINVEKGQKCSRAVIAELNDRREALLQGIDRAAAETARLSDELAALPQTQKPTDADIDGLVRSHPQYKAIQDEINQAEQQLTQGISTDADTDDLNEAKNVLTDAIAQLKATIEGRRHLKRNNDRIAELEEQLRSQAEALAHLEGIEFTMAEFAKARISAIEGKINAMFRLVRFKMYETQINGGESETCEATVGGVPFSSQNDAMRINMGLDIINAIARSEGVCAPIFIDNAESILQPIETEGQQIRLIVADKELTIDTGDTEDTNLEDDRY